MKKIDKTFVMKYEHYLVNFDNRNYIVQIINEDNETEIIRIPELYLLHIQKITLTFIPMLAILFAEIESKKTHYDLSGKSSSLTFIEKNYNNDIFCEHMMLLLSKFLVEDLILTINDMSYEEIEKFFLY